jgi:hypothetical protein
MTWAISGGSSPPVNGSSTATCGRRPSRIWTLPRDGPRPSERPGGRVVPHVAGPRRRGSRARTGFGIAAIGCARPADHVGTPVALRAIRVMAGGVLMGPAAWGSGVPVVGPSAGPVVRPSHKTDAPKAPPQSAWTTRTSPKRAVCETRRTSPRPGSGPGSQTRGERPPRIREALTPRLAARVGPLGSLPPHP